MTLISRRQDFSLRGSTPDKDCDSLIPPICGLADEPIHRWESILPNLMEEPVNMRPEMRYNLYGTLKYLSYLIIPQRAGSSESVFLILGQKNGAAHN